MKDSLTPRLLAASSHIRRGAVLADIGTDHAYLPIYLVENKIADRAVAADINEGPIERARVNIELAGLSDSIDTVCTDGLCGLVRDEEILDVLMQEHASILDYRNNLFTAALDAGGYDNVTIALFECMSVKQTDLASTIAPSESKRKVKAEKTENDSKKPRRIWLVAAVLLLLALLAAAAFHFDVITIDDAKNIHFNLKSITL